MAKTNSTFGPSCIDPLSDNEQLLGVQTSSVSSAPASSIIDTCLRRSIDGNSNNSRNKSHDNSLCDNGSNRQGCRRLFSLRGPVKSGKSSLLMDAALAVASNEPCRCHSMLGQDLLMGQSNTDHCRVRLDQSCQHCTAVTVIVPAMRDRPFPLPCDRMDESLCSNSNNFGGPPSNARRKDRQREDKIIAASKRIHVRHVTSLKDVISYLLSVTGLPLEEQPAGGIFIDDIDSLCMRNDAATTAIRFSQTGMIGFLCLLLEISQFDSHFQPSVSLSFFDVVESGDTAGCHFDHVSDT